MRLTEQQECIVLADLTARVEFTTARIRAAREGQAANFGRDEFEDAMQRHVLRFEAAEILARHG